MEPQTDKPKLDPLDIVKRVRVREAARGELNGIEKLVLAQSDEIERLTRELAEEREHHAITVTEYKGLQGERDRLRAALQFYAARGHRVAREALAPDSAAGSPR